MLSVADYLSGNLNGYVWAERLEQRFGDLKCLERYGFKVYSQNDEDGIIEEIFNRIGVTNKTFIEFGVQDGIESNGHYLLHKGWNGLWIECDNESYEQIQRKFKHVIEKRQLVVDCQFITVGNINSIFKKNDFIGEIDLLSIDIDGNDYHVWKAIDIVSPRVVVIEYNAKFPPACHWIMPYCEEQIWDRSDKHSASLSALMELGNQKGYSLVGTNASGVNAFFVRNDCVKDFFYCNDLDMMYNPPRFYKEYYVAHPSLYCLSGLPEGRSQLFCGTNQKVLMGMGFCTKESAGYWMNSLNSCIWIDNMDGEIAKVVIHIQNPKTIFNVQNESCKLKIQFEDRLLVEKDFIENEEYQTIDIPQRGIFKIGLSTEKLWVPADYIPGNDTRRLGLLIRDVKYSKGMD